MDLDMWLWLWDGEMSSPSGTSFWIDDLNEFMIDSDGDRIIFSD